MARASSAKEAAAQNICRCSCGKASQVVGVRQSPVWKQMALTQTLVTSPRETWHDDHEAHHRWKPARCQAPNAPVLTILHGGAAIGQREKWWLDTRRRRPHLTPVSPEFVYRLPTSKAMFPLLFSCFLPGHAVVGNVWNAKSVFWCGNSRRINNIRIFILYYFYISLWCSSKFIAEGWGHLALRNLNRWYIFIKIHTYTHTHTHTYNHTHVHMHI